MTYAHGQLEGRNIFQWREEWQELAQRFVEYADHKPSCHIARIGHLHIGATDDARTVCHAAPCTCGVLIILGVMIPDGVWAIECPDMPIPLPYHRSVPKTD